MGLLLSKVLPRVKYLAIERGQIILIPKNGDVAARDKWLKENRDQFLAEILTATGRTGYQYIDYSTGFYNGANKAGGITLQFLSFGAFESACISYNVELRRPRNTSSAKAGSSLPKGRFIAPKGGAFVRLWQSTGLSLPNRLSAFHDCMGKLKRVVFTGEVVKQRFKKGTLELINISFEEIQRATNQANSPHNSLTRTRQEPDKNLTSLPDKGLALSPINHGLQACYGAGVSECGIKVKGITGKGDCSTEDIQTVKEDDWGKEYDQALRALN